MTDGPTTAKVSKGDIVHVDYDAYIAESGMLFDTTNADKAKEAGIFNENLTYKPMPVLVGGGRVFPGLDEALAEAKVGERTTVGDPPRRRPPGPGDPKLVENHPPGVSSSARTSARRSAWRSISRTAWARSSQ